MPPPSPRCAARSSAKYGFPARFSDLTDLVGSKVGLKRAPRAGILVAVDPDPGEPRTD